MFTNTVLTPWLVLPLAGALMLVIAAHIGFVHEHTEDPHRRRIRVANGWVMLVMLALLGAGFGVVSPGALPRLFWIVWAAVIALLLVTVVLAVADVMNTLRLARETRRRLVVETAQLAAQDIRERKARADLAGAEDPA